MTADIYIIGTSHTIQCGGQGCPKAIARAFEDELRTAKEKGRVTRICEEINSEGLAEYNVEKTIAQHFAEQESIEHQMVDLSIAERSSFSLDTKTLSTLMKNLHIEDGSHINQVFSDMVNGVRERVWLARILSRDEWPVLFICGAEHAVSVRRLCCALGIESKVVHIDFQA